MIQNNYSRTHNKQLIIAVIFAIIGSLLFLIKPMTVAAAESSCYFKTTPKDGKFYYEKKSCPSDVNSNDGKCYVINSSSNVIPYDNVLLCGQYMVDEMIRVSAIPYGCPYGPSNNRSPVPGVKCPYDANKFGILNQEFIPGTSPRTLLDEEAANCVDSTDPKCNFIDAFINPAIKFLSAGVGVIVTIMIVIGGIQYASAGNDPQKISAAKRKIMNAIIALVLYIMLFAILNWLIPGGII